MQPTFLRKFFQFNCVLISFFIILFVCTGCSSVLRQEQSIVSGSNLVLAAGQTVGQTLTANYAGLDAVEFYFSPLEPGTGKITLAVGMRDDPQDLVSAVLPVSAVTVPGFYRFQFNPIGNSNKKNLILNLVVEGTGSVSVGIAPGSSYLDGAAYKQNIPFDAQLAFHLLFDPGSQMGGLFREMASWLKWALLAIFLFILPGLASLEIFKNSFRPLSGWERIGLAGGLSLGLYPILMLWANLVGLNSSFVYAFIPGALSAGYLAWVLFRKYSSGNWTGFTLARIELADIILVILLAAIFWVRFYAIRSIDFPMWGDSYQHTLMAQLIIDHQGLFNSWQPYTDLFSFTYHFGFHAGVAVFDWISGLETPKAVLVIGQVFNGMAVLSLIPLALRIGKGNKWAGVVAVMTGGLLTQMPMYYTNWGRYTQLAGQVILPAAVWVAWKASENKDRRSLLLASIAWGGLALTHFRVLLFGVPFFIPVLLNSLRMRKFKFTVLRIGIMGLGGLFIFLPWLFRLSSGLLVNFLFNQLSTPASSFQGAVQSVNAIGPLTDYLPAWIWLAAGLAAILLFIRKEGDGLIFLAWWGLLVLETNPNLFGLPGAGIITNFAVEIAAYIPTSILIGYLAGFIHRPIWVPPRVGLALFIPILGLIVVAGMSWRIDDLDIPAHAYVTHPDEIAASWINQNIPQNASFLVNTAFAYNGSSIVGTDAGWWLPYMAKRQTNLPPLTYTAEKGPQPDYVSWINSLSKTILQQGLASQAALGMLQDRGFSYVYIGQQNRGVNYNGPAFLDLNILSTNPHFSQVYHQDRVWIFKIIY
jgi:hypothetical protein